MRRGARLASREASDMWAHNSQCLAYVIYLVWLGFGCVDFAIHRRTALALTSGLRESALHGLQMLLVGAGVLLWAALDSSRAVAALLGCIAAAHAAAAYADTVVAVQERRVTPLEQHVHSVLDIAPWTFVGYAAWTADPTWTLTWQPQPLWVWVALVLPTLPTVLLPWMAEFRAAWLARHSD